MTKSAVPCGSAIEFEAIEEQGALYIKAIAPATHGLAKEVPEVFE